MVLAILFCHTFPYQKQGVHMVEAVSANAGQGVVSTQLARVQETQPANEAPKPPAPTPAAEATPTPPPTDSGRGAKVDTTA